MRKDRHNKRMKKLENHISRTGGTRKSLTELREQVLEWVSKLRDENMTTSKIQNIAIDYYRLLYEKQKNQNQLRIPSAIIPNTIKLKGASGKKTELGNQGLNINGARLSHLRFADDLVILEEDPLTLSSMIQTLLDRSREVGLEMNTSKTKVMNTSTPTDITANRQKHEYVYLGQIISPKNHRNR
nr:uncharacterized protein LOC116776493 [Danaus plexippus plexippus]